VDKAGAAQVSKTEDPSTSFHCEPGHERHTGNGRRRHETGAARHTHRSLTPKSRSVRSRRQCDITLRGALSCRQLQL